MQPLSSPSEGVRNDRDKAITGEAPKAESGPSIYSCPVDHRKHSLSVSSDRTEENMLLLNRCLQGLMTPHNGPGRQTALVPGHKTELPEPQAPLFLLSPWQRTESTGSLLSHRIIPAGGAPAPPGTVTVLLSGLLSTSVIKMVPALPLSPYPAHHPLTPYS